MKTRAILSVLLFFFLIPTALTIAQSPGMRGKPGMGMRHWKMDEQCSRASDLNLSAEQAKALEVIQQTYFRETRVLRAELFLKRLDLREFFINPSAKAESIRAKYTELNELQAKLEDKMIDYLLKVRGLLTTEQVRQWCPEQEIPAPFRRMMQGMEPMGPRHPRRLSPQEGWKED